MKIIWKGKKKSQNREISRLRLKILLAALTVESREIKKQADIILLGKREITFAHEMLLDL